MNSRQASRKSRQSRNIVFVTETIKGEGGVSQACLGKSTSCILDIHNMVN